MSTTQVLEMIFTSSNDLMIMSWPALLHSIEILLNVPNLALHEGNCPGGKHALLGIVKFNNSRSDIPEHSDDSALSRLIEIPL